MSQTKNQIINFGKIWRKWNLIHLVGINSDISIMEKKNMVILSKSKDMYALKYFSSILISIIDWSSKELETA